MRIHSILGLLMVATAFSGCENRTPEDLSDQATKQLGVPVFVWIYPDDECAKRQLRAVWEEYKDLSGSAQRAFRERLKRYDAIILNASEQGGRVTGAVVRVDYEGSGPDGSKTINELRVDSSRRPGTRIVKGRELEMTTVASEDRSVFLRYETEDRGLYDSLSTDAAARMEAATRAGKAELKERKPYPALNCGRLARLADFF
jgi:hypothetical protein